MVGYGLTEYQLIIYLPCVVWDAMPAMSCTGMYSVGIRRR